MYHYPNYIHSRSDRAFFDYKYRNVHYIYIYIHTHNHYVYNFMNTYE